MGIDAEILLRVAGKKPTDAQVAAWSWNICASIGARHFFIQDGIPSPEYQKAEKAWHESFNKHRLHPEWEAFSKSGNYEKRKEVHELIFADIGKAPEQRRRAIEFTNALYPLDDDDSGVPVEYREPGRCATQDGDTIFAGPNEWLLEVKVWSRYYGIGYERGDLLTLCAIAEWCEANIPNVKVWYGGDSSGMIAKPWPDSERAKLRHHLYTEEGRGYSFCADGGERKPKGIPDCSLCVPDRGLKQTGFGGQYEAWHCSGCNKTFETRDGGPYVLRKDKEAA